MRHSRLMVLTLLLLLIAPSLRAAPPASAKKEPFLLTLVMFAPMSSKYGWTLIVDGEGLAQLSLARSANPEKRTFHVSAKEMARFRKLLVEQKFYALDAKYGGAVPDSSERTLSITQGRQSKSIHLGFLREEDPHLPEVKRALLVWNAAQSWFHEPAAQDLRPYEKKRFTTARP